MLQLLNLVEKLSAAVRALRKNETDLAIYMKEYRWFAL